LIAYLESLCKCFHEEPGLTAENDPVKSESNTLAADDDIGEGSGIEKSGMYYQIQHPTIKRRRYTLSDHP
jgi:hypothetical protein